ncbi:Uncharacterised protein [Moraxella lacunata]|uniref:Uncharacterized protein n=1 Tax=Moraxella lacunata TaxID=477 RepID=A0A378T8W5_MORLA|nr:hypothetical protein [Moraxella lacunata]STZ56295.1 Uncharacterised protein [Moraxella lacunata]
MNTLSEFGKNLICNVRDPVLSDLEKLIDGQIKSEQDTLFHQRISQLSPDEILLLKELSTYLVDKTLHNLLFIFENSDNCLILSDDKNLAEISDGLCGELYTDDGWIGKFSQYKASI